MSEKTDGRPDDFDELLERIRDILSPVECHFLKSIEELQELEDKK